MASFENVGDEDGGATTHHFPLDFHKRFGASFHEDLSDDDLDYGQDDENEIDQLSSLSAIERAAHEDTISSLQEMFPAWSHNDLEALLSSCGDKMEDAVEEIMRLGEGGATHAAADVSNKEEEDSNGQLDLSENMTRTQLDDYERHIINQIQVKENVEEHITLALNVPKGARPGSSINVRMIDGSKYNVTIPMGVKTGEKFLAEFPTAPMRQAAQRRLTGRNHDTHGDDFLSVVEGDQQGQLNAALAESRINDNGDDDDDDDLAKALAASLKEGNEAADRQKHLEAEEEEMIKMALMHSELDASKAPDHVF